MKRYLRKLSIIHYPLFISAALLLMEGCSEHESLQQDTGKSVRIDIRGEVLQEYVTRANDGGFADGDNIGVFIVNRDGRNVVALKAEGNHADNVKFTYDAASGLWTGAYDLYWKDLNTSVDAYSYYPFNSSLSSVEAFPLTIREKQLDVADGEVLSGYEASDFLWAKAENVAPGNTINLKHQHVMAGVQVILEQGSGFTADSWNTLQKVVLIENTRVNTLVNLSTGAVSLADETVKTIVPQQKGLVWRAVVAPQAIVANKTLLNITVDGISYEYKRNSQTTLQPGKLHKFTIKVDKRGPSGDYDFSLIGEAITPWENDWESHNGAAREYITIHVNEGEFLGDVVESMRLDPKEIINLKLTGSLIGDNNFTYIRESLTNLEAINMKSLRTKEQYTMDMEAHYGFSQVNDDFLPKDAFVDMHTLNYVVWPDSLKGIGTGAFAGTGLRGSLILPDGLKFIGGDAFCAWSKQATNLTGDLYIPSTVEYIGDMAFGNYDDVARCFFKNELVLPSRMRYLGSGAFAGCPFLTGIIRIPEGLDVVNNSFAPNMTAKTVEIPQGIKKVNGLGGQPTSIIFPEGVTEINSLFGEPSQPWLLHDGPRKSLRFVSLPSTLNKLGDWAFAGSGIQHVAIPEGIEVIPYYAFGQCSLQDTLTIPKSVLQIKEQAFYANKMLSAVILPENLQEIQSEAFAYCSSLYYVCSLNPEPPSLADDAFDGVEKNECALVVPEGSEDAYRNAEGWKEFKRISAYQNFVCRPMQAKLLNKSNTRTIVLNSDGKWKVSDCPNWIHLSKTSGNKKTELSVTIDALGQGASDREGKIVFMRTDKTDENGQAITCCYDVRQFNYEYKEDSQIQLQKATKGKGINIVFVGDGYDAEDIAEGSFLEDMKEGMGYFFAVEPYKTYKDYFNVYADFAMSYESGVCSNVNIWRQTKFGTTYGGANGRLGIKDIDVFNYVLNDVANSAITDANVNQSLIICVPNDDAYEGVTAMYSSGAAIAFVPHSRYDYPNDYRGLIQHEAGGHGFGKLGDEYIYHQKNIWTCRCICCGHTDALTASKALGWYRNLSLNGRYKEIDWTHLIFDSRYGDIVDIYEGGYMHKKGVYRSEYNSCMNNNIPYYNTISRQAIVERIMEYSGGKFDFETFVSKDSREMGEKFQTRSGGMGSAGTVMHNSAPIVRKGSPLNYIKKKGGNR